MEVRAEEKAIVDFMHTALRVWPDVGGLEHGERVLLSDRARSTVRVSNGNPERALSEAWPNQRWLAVSFPLFAHNEGILHRSQADSSFLAFTPDACALADLKVVTLVSEVPSRPVG